MKAWAVAKAGAVYYTDDDGLNWVHQDSGTTEDLNGVCFTNTSGDNLWAVGDNGVVIGTTNGGQTWQGYNSGVTTKLRGCFLDGISFGLTWGDKETFIESNTFGSNFIPHNTGTDKDLYAFSLKPGMSPGTFTGDGILVGDGTILTTTDFGNNFTEVFTSVIAGFSFRLKALSYLSDGTAYAVGQNVDDSKALKSTDDGATWVQFIATF